MSGFSFGGYAVGVESDGRAFVYLPNGQLLKVVASGPGLAKRVSDLIGMPLEDWADDDEIAELEAA